MGDYDGALLHLRQHKAQHYGAGTLTHGISPSAGCLSWLIVQQVIPTADDALLFLSDSNNSQGKRLSYWGIYKFIEELAALAEVDGCHSHRLRHTFATTLFCSRDRILVNSFHFRIEVNVRVGFFCLREIGIACLRLPSIASWIPCLSRLGWGGRLS